MRLLLYSFKFSSFVLKGRARFLDTIGIFLPDRENKINIPTTAKMPLITMSKLICKNTKLAGLKNAISKVNPETKIKNTDVKNPV